MLWVDFFVGELEEQVSQAMGGGSVTIEIREMGAEGEKEGAEGCFISSKLML